MNTNAPTTRPARRDGCRHSPASLLITVSVLLPALCLPGCPERQFTESGAAGLEKFASPEAFKQYLADQVEAMQYWGGRGAPIFNLFGGPMLAQPLAAPAAEGDAGGDYSTTNVQEEGVDEGDVVKNDGTYLYILTPQGVTIVQADPTDQMAVLAEVELPGSPAVLYLRGAQLAALSDVAAAGGSDTAVTIIDIAARSAPEIVATLSLEGRRLTSRVIDAKLHLVLNVQPDLPEEPGQVAILARSVDELIPDVRVTTADGGQHTQNIVGWDNFYHPVDPDGWGTTAVVTIDLDEPGAPIESKGVVADAGTVYASRHALYLTDLEYNYAGQTRETTDVYKFDFTETGAALVGAGSIPGRLLNRFSLGEHEGFLRAATTVGRVTQGEDAETTASGVYVLAPEEGELKTVGLVEGIAPGEQIYSARFIGDRGFLVTFKKVDPLYTLSLSDPTAPVVVGELKVPGYSDYIHPLGAHHLLTIGKDATDVGDFAWFQGVQLSVFDVSDFATPQQVDVEIVGTRGTESEALHDAHAFNYFAPAEMLAVPMLVAEGPGPDPWNYGTPTFDGLCLYRVIAEEGIEPLGRIETRGPAGTYDRWGYAGWTRGVFIGDYVYAVTGSNVRAVPLSDLGAVPYELSLN